MAQHTNKEAQFRSITANSLLDGHVVYFSDHGWVSDLNDASVAEGLSSSEALLLAANSFISDCEVVGVYLFAVTISTSGKIIPCSVRELIRCSGPSISLDLFTSEET